MEVLNIAETQREEYDNFIADHPRGTFLQSWAWGEWQMAQNKTVSRYLFIDSGKIIGVAQVVLMNTFLGSYFYCPYGPFLQEGLSDDLIKNLFILFREELQKTTNIMFIRVEPTTNIDMKKIGAVKAESVQPPQTLIKSIGAPEDELMQSFHQKTRYNIRVAQRHGLSITTHDRVNKKVVELIMQTSDRQGYRNHSALYIEKLWQFFNGNSQNLTVTGYLAEKDATAIAGGLMVDFGKTRMYLFGGSDYEHRNMMAPYLMHWQAMLDAKNTGFNFYDFGASENASGHSGGYMRFKMGFNPEIVNFSGTHDLITQPGVYWIYKLLRKINRLRLHA